MGDPIDISTLTGMMKSLAEHADLNGSGTIDTETEFNVFESQAQMELIFGRISQEEYNSVFGNNAVSQTGNGTADYTDNEDNEVYNRTLKPAIIDSGVRDTSPEARERVLGELEDLGINFKRRNDAHIMY